MAAPAQLIRFTLQLLGVPLPFVSKSNVRSPCAATSASRFVAVNW
jgi:hypothetical protein